MDAAAALSLGYAVSGVAAALLYLPQLRLLWRSAAARRAMAPVTWGGWAAVGGITLLYAVVVVGQPVMIAVVGANALCQVAVFVLAAGQRIIDRNALDPRNRGR